MSRVHYRLSLRLTVAMFLLSLAVCMLWTGVQLRFKYTENIDAVQQALDQVGTADLQGIVASLWQMDTDMLHIQLHALAQRRGFAHVYVEKDGKILMETSATHKPAPIVRTYPLIHASEDQTCDLGNLVIEASLDSIRAQIEREFLNVLIDQAIITGILALLMLLLFHRMIGRHLHALSAQVQDIFPNHLEQPLRLTKIVRGDELDQVTASLEAMRLKLLEAFTTLNAEIAERLRTEEHLSQAKAQAEAAMYAKTQFLANMSHEIRTPMNGVMGMIQLAMDSHSPETARSCLETAERSSRSLLRLLNDILDLTRLEAARMPVVEEVFSIGKLMDDVSDGFQAVTMKKRLELRCTVDRAVPRYLSGDTVRIRQILTNLLGNAMKFTQEGRVEVRVSCLSQLTAGEHRILFEVEDTGPGIPDDIQPLLFQPFAQGDASRTRKYGGSGLGLSITHHLVTLLHGTIAYESEPGRTLFCVCLPLPAATEPLPEPETDDTTIPVMPQLSVLVAEDNQINSAIALRFLEKLGHQGTLAVNGQDAVDLMRMHRYDVVLMDIQMPELDGIEATRIIRSWPKAEGGSTPIIAMTAHAFPSDGERCAEAGMNGHLTKPFSLNDLSRMLQEAVSAAHD